MVSGNGEMDDGQSVKDQAPSTVGAAQADAGDAVVAKLAAERDDYRNKLLYMQADFDNYRKRMERREIEIRATANEALILELLDAYENLGRALEAAKKADAQPSQIAKGLEMVNGQMKAVLEKYGLRPIEAVGKTFDPRTMEAVMQEASAEAEDDTVLEEFQRGYTLNSKVIRCSKVKVSRK